MLNVKRLGDLSAQCKFSVTRSSLLEFSVTAKSKHGFLVLCYLIFIALEIEKKKVLYMTKCVIY